MINKDDYNLLLKYRTPNPEPSEQLDHERFRALVERGFIRMNRYHTIGAGPLNSKKIDVADDWIITAKGIDALSEFEEEAAKQAQEERDKRFNKKISILNLLMPFITFVVGLFIEHKTGIFDWVISFFQRFFS